MIVINLITTMALYGLPYSIFIFLYSDYSCLVPLLSGEDLSLVQRDRLAYIDFRLYFFGEIGRPDLIERFGVAPAGATRDLALYRKLCRITSPSMVATRSIASVRSSPRYSSTHRCAFCRRCLSVLAME